MTTAENPRAVIGDNQPPRTPFEIIRDEIEELLVECRNWADGEPIASQEMHDEVERLHDMLSEAGKRADEERKAEAKPFDDAKAEIQERYNKLIGNTKSGKGKVVLGKEALIALLTPFRTEKQRKAAEAARIAREEADAKAAAATAALQASRGNLEEREKAEALLIEAKAADRGARREFKAATTGTGLRSVWVATMTDESTALEWAYDRDPARFTALVQEMAEGAVRAGLRKVPGFRVEETKVAR